MKETTSNSYQMYVALVLFSAIAITEKSAEAGSVQLFDDSQPFHYYDVRADYFAGSGGGGFAGGYIEIDRDPFGAGKLEVGGYAGPGDCIIEPVYCGSLTTIGGTLKYKLKANPSAAFYAASGAPPNVQIPMDLNIFALVGGDGYSTARVFLDNQGIVAVTPVNPYQSREEVRAYDGSEIRFEVYTRIGQGVSVAIADPIAVIDPDWEYAAYSHLITISDTFPQAVRSDFGDPLPSAVPLPASFPLMALGLGMLAFFRPRKGSPISRFLSTGR